MPTGSAKGSLKSGSEYPVLQIIIIFVTGITLFYWEVLVVYYMCNPIYKEESLEEFIFTISVSINANVSIC